MNALDPFRVPLDGTVLIEASAGTGKTWTLATLYLRLLVERRLQVGQILVVTYTNAATAELRDRIRGRLREAVAYFEQAESDDDPTRATIEAADTGSDPLAQLVAFCRAAGTLEQSRKHLAAALRGFDEAAIFTIHGFCQRILLENAFESGVMFDAELVTDERPLCSEVVKDFWVRHLHDAPAVLVRHLQKELSPNKLEKLARKVLASRDMPVLPEQPEDVDRAAIAQAVERWRTAIAETAGLWASCANEIRSLLDPTVLKNSYREDAIALWCSSLTTYLARDAGASPVEFEHLDRFTSAVLADNTRAKKTTPRHAFFSSCDRLLAAQDAVVRECARHTLRLQLELVAEVRAEVRRRHEVANTQSFDDLLYRLRDALASAGGDALARQIRDRFRAALIDEFQDTDPVQYAIFRALYVGSEAPLFLIGDPKQAIYAFRGADVFTYVEAKENAGANAHTLQVNHRSTSSLVTAVNTLFARVARPFVFDQIPFTKVAAASSARDAPGGEIATRPPLEILYLKPADAQAGPVTKDWANRNVPDAIAADIVRLLATQPSIGGRPLHAGDIAVLCRKNQQAVAVQEALRRLGVPSVRQGDDSVFTSAEAEELERVLRAIAEPSDPSLLRAALATRLVGLDAADLAALQGDETMWDLWAARFREWLDTWVAQGFMAGFRQLLDTCKTQRRLLALDDGERRLTNLLHLAELLQAAAREAHRGPLALVDWFALLRDDPVASAELASEAAQIRLESDEKAVKLVTIHRSKGLEYGVVYCPYTWEGTKLHDDDKSWVRFHDRVDQILRLDLGSDAKEEHLRRAELEAFAENLRLLYVAITRARHRCTLIWADVRDDHLTPLGYLLHQTPTTASGAALVTATQAHVKALDRAARLADLADLTAASQGTIAFRELALPAVAPPPLAGGRERGHELEPCSAHRALERSWRVSSFSGLVASGGRTSHQATEGLDHDAVGTTDAGDQAFLAPRAPQRITLHELPAGARTGELLHSILEHTDFQRRDPDELAVRVRDAIAAYGFEPRWEGPLCQALEEALATPIGDAGADARFTLAEVAPGKRFNEMQFLFAVRSGFDQGKLARCFEQHPSPARPGDYADRLRRLGFPALEGYLGGFIDLVLEHDGRWYVIDYKSNFLGPRPASYAPARLRQAMSLHHYYLQYHLYVLAVHRYLTSRLPGYDYERDFGGVAYLFLRGMAPGHAAGCGVFFDRPSVALLNELSQLVGTPPEAPS